MTASASLNLSLLFLFAATVLLWLWRRRRALIAPLFVVLLGLDLAVASAGFNPTTQDVLVGYHRLELVAFLRARAHEGRIDTRTGVADQLQPNLAMLHQLDDVAGLFNPLTLRSFDSYWERLGSRSVPGYDLLAARWIVARRDAPLDPARFARVFEAPAGLAVFENGKALPRAFVAARAERLDEAAVAARLREPGFDPRAVAFVDGDAAPGSGGATYERLGPNTIRIGLRDVTGGVLVVSEAHYPGWSATVDGQPAAVLRAYNALIGVPLPAGAREARLEFRPRFWTSALALSLAAWAAIAAAALLAARRGLPSAAGERP